MSDHQPDLRGIIDRIAAQVGYQIEWAAMPIALYFDSGNVLSLCDTAARIATDELKADLYDTVADHFRDMTVSATSSDELDGAARDLAAALYRSEERQAHAAHHRDRLCRILAALGCHDAAVPLPSTLCGDRPAPDQPDADRTPANDGQELARPDGPGNKPQHGIRQHTAG